MESDIKEIRELAEKFSPDEIEGCITQQLETGENICLRNESSERIISELAKAQFVKRLVEDGLSLADAVRRLAGKMRQLQQGFRGGMSSFDKSDNSVQRSKP